MPIAASCTPSTDCARKKDFSSARHHSLDAVDAAPMMMRLLATLLAVEATYPGPHRGYRGMPETERIEFYERNGYRWPPTTATRG